MTVHSKKKVKLTVFTKCFYKHPHTYERTNGRAFTFTNKRTDMLTCIVEYSKQTKIILKQLLLVVSRKTRV